MNKQTDTHHMEQWPSEALTPKSGGMWTWKCTIYIKEKGHNSYISNSNFKEFTAWKGSSIDQGLLDYYKHPNICSFVLTGYDR